MEIVAGIIFAAVLVTLAFDWVQRTKAALIGALVFVVIGVLDLEHAIHAIDWPTLGLLAGMMIIVGITEQTGVFTFLALRIAQLSRGNPFWLMALLAREASEGKVRQFVAAGISTLCRMCRTCDMHSWIVTASGEAGSVRSLQH